MADPLRNLAALRHRVDHHAARVMGHYLAHFACKRGCTGCCQTERTVSDVEYEALRLAVARLPAPTRARLVEAAAGTPCPLLLDGGCAVYADRPVICRSHGLPLVMEEQLDVCPLNFTGGDIAALPREDVLSIDVVTTILVAVNQLFCQETGGETTRRRPVGALLRD